MLQKKFYRLLLFLVLISFKKTFIKVNIHLNLILHGWVVIQWGS